MLACFFTAWKQFLAQTPTTTLTVWARKTLESASSEIGILSDTHQTRSDFALMTKVLATDDPFTYAQTKDKPKWEKAMTGEYDSLMKNKTWTLVPIPPRKNLVGCKWIYKPKFTADGQTKKKCFISSKKILSTRRY